MRTHYSTALALALGTLLLAGAGCTADDTTTTNTATTTKTDSVTVAVDEETDAVVVEDTDAATDEVVVDDTAETDAEATIRILEPVDGDTVESSFDLSVEISGLTLAPDKVEGENAEGEGHYHVWVDGEYFAPGVADITTLEGLEAGEHELMVSLQNNDHTDLVPETASEPVTVTVE